MREYIIKNFMKVVLVVLITIGAAVVCNVLQVASFNTQYLPRPSLNQVQGKASFIGYSGAGISAWATFIVYYLWRSILWSFKRKNQISLVLAAGTLCVCLFNTYSARKNYLAMNSDVLEGRAFYLDEGETGRTIK